MRLSWLCCLVCYNEVIHSNPVFKGYSDKRTSSIREQMVSSLPPVKESDMKRHSKFKGTLVNSEVSPADRFHWIKVSPEDRFHWIKVPPEDRVSLYRGVPWRQVSLYRGVPWRQVSLYRGVPWRQVSLYRGVPWRQVSLYKGVPWRQVSLCIEVSPEDRFHCISNESAANTLSINCHVCMHTYTIHSHENSETKLNLFHEHVDEYHVLWIINYLNRSFIMFIDLVKLATR